jgi:hypothetical protein
MNSTLFKKNIKFKDIEIVVSPITKRKTPLDEEEINALKVMRKRQVNKVLEVPSVTYGTLTM